MSEPMEQQDPLSPVKRAIVELREMRARLDALEHQRHEPIAIIGAGLRFPGGANDPDSFWRLLANGSDAIREVPPGRWDVEAHFDADPDAPGKMYSRQGGFLDHVDRFDPQFFGIAPREAASMDPQQRLLLEVGWEALEDAAQAPDQLADSLTGVFVGIANSDYFRIALARPEEIDAYAATGNSFSITASRLSYFLGLHGPALAIDTACSSSLVAVHLAVRSLRARECDLALAGGVNLILTPELSINFCKARMLSADGRCKTFAAAADGYGRGEGCALVVLKRLSDAQAHGDRILALIRGSAVNQDGRSSGITAPNGPAQEAVIRAALADARVMPQEVGFVETHGTGTPLGDPIEARALGVTLGRQRANDGPLVLGAVKTNIGHLEAAAGIAGLIKTALVLRHGVIPPNLHLREVNPYIPLDELGLQVPTTAMAWPGGAARRIAGVSSFGFSGTNAHVVVEAAPTPTAAAGEWERPLHVLALAARSGPALMELASRYERHLTEYREAPFADVCFTANVGRAHFPHRLAVVADCGSTAREQLAHLRDGRQPRGIARGHAEDDGRSTGIAFLFAGQGSHYVGMGRRLYQTQPLFRAALERCEALLRPHLEHPLLEVLYPGPGVASPLDETRYTQPALFAVEYALAELWRSWGIEPCAVAGHSLGEYVAACVAGVFTLEDALALIVERARLTQSLPPGGAMAAVFADEHTVADAIAPFANRVAVAAINAPENTVISGDGQTLAAILSTLSAQGVGFKSLAVSQAFHSPRLDPILDAFERKAAGIAYARPRIDLVSNLTGDRVSAAEIGQARYWRRHLREPVRFADSIAALQRLGCNLFVEIGPQPVLSGLAQALSGGEHGAWIASLRRGEDDWRQMLEGLSTLYAQGATVDWEAFDRDCTRRRLALPTYPFQRSRYWLDRPASGQHVPLADPAALWECAIAAARRQAGQAPLGLAPETYPDTWGRLERLTTAYIVQALRELGAFVSDNENYTVDEALERFAVRPTYRHLLQRWFERLAAQGLLQRRSDGFASPLPLTGPPVEPCLRDVEDAFAAEPFFPQYLRHCGSLLAEVLTGRQSALETLFSDGSPALAEALYTDWIVSRYFSGIAAAVAAAVAGAARPGALRILEIGAGTGGTAAAVLAALPPGRVAAYCFTDISEFFFSRAREKFCAYPCLRTALLDIERDPAEQGFAPHGFDVVVATNVLHATADLGGTLDHVLALLAPGGLLLLCEVTEHLAWFDVTTGLIEGWQRFEDGWRTDSPLLSPGQWEELLRERGFDAVAAFPEAGSPARVLGQHAIVARTPQAPAGTVLPTAANLEVVPTGSAAWGGRAEAARGREPWSDLLQRLREAPIEERHDLVLEYVRTQVAGVLRMEAAQLPDRRARLMDLGIDSLMAVELRNRLGNGLDLPRKLPATLVFDYPTAEAIARLLDRELFGLQEGGEPLPMQRAEDRGLAAAAERIAGLSDEEVEAMLLERLERRQGA